MQRNINQINKNMLDEIDCVSLLLLLVAAHVKSYRMGTFSPGVVHFVGNI